MQDKGKFIVIDGIDGAGKSTQVENLEGWLIAKGKEVVRVREPGGTPMAEQLRSILKDFNNKIEVFSHKTELLLFFAAREQLINNVIKPALEQGKWVLADRFYLSSLAYQGHGLGLVTEAEELVNMVVSDNIPDLQIVLNVGYPQAKARMLERGAVDRIELRGEKFFNKISTAFLHYAKMPQHNIKMIPADQPVDVVSKYIENIVQRELF